MSRRPSMIPVLRIAGAIALAVSTLLLGMALSEQEGAPLLLILAAAAGATGLLLLGFASNLLILHEMRAELRRRSDHEL